MHYFDNPGGLIPSWLINWGAKVCIVKLFTDCSFFLKGLSHVFVKAGLSTLPDNPGHSRF